MFHSLNDFVLSLHFRGGPHATLGVMVALGIRISQGWCGASAHTWIMTPRSIGVDPVTRRAHLLILHMTLLTALVFSHSLQATASTANLGDSKAGDPEDAKSSYGADCRPHRVFENLKAGCPGDVKWGSGAGCGFCE